MLTNQEPGKYARRFSVKNSTDLDLTSDNSLMPAQEICPKISPVVENASQATVPDIVPTVFVVTLRRHWSFRFNITFISVIFLNEKEHNCANEN